MTAVSSSALPAAASANTRRESQRRPARLLLAGALLMVTAHGPATAQDGDANDPGDGRYAIEVIVFRHLDQGGSTPEVPLPGPAAGAVSSMVPAVDSSGPNPGPSAAGTAWPALEPSELQLAAIAARLRRGGAYQLLYHGGWMQPAERQSSAGPTPLPPDAMNSGAGGSITVYRERYLHAVVDIGLQMADGSVDELRRIRQGRRLRGQAVQYFDSPAIGVLLSARPVSATAAAPDPTATR
jgi:hypothetical protein